jgi:hypothetical protein
VEKRNHKQFSLDKNCKHFEEAVKGGETAWKYGISPSTPSVFIKGKGIIGENIKYSS